MRRFDSDPRLQNYGQIELRKAAHGRKTKLPDEIVIYEASQGYPAIQRRLARAFGSIG